VVVFCVSGGLHTAGTMARKMVDMPEMRHQCSLAVKREVPIPDLVAKLKETRPDKAAELDGYLGKYQGGMPATAVYTMCKMLVGCETCKDAFENLVPGYTRSWAPSPHEHPIVV